MNEMDGKSMLSLYPPCFTCSSLLVSQLKEEQASGSVGGKEEEAEDCFLLGEGKGIDTSRNHPPYVDISLPLRRGRLSVR